MKSLFLGVLLAAAIFLGGCATMMKPQPSICDGVQGSFLCDEVKDPRKADVLLQLANYEVLRHGVFSKEDVMTFFNELELFVENVQTWADLVLYVTNRVETLKEKLGVELYIVSQYADLLNADIPINDFDKKLILVHIENQKKIVSLYTGD